MQPAREKSLSGSLHRQYKSGSWSRAKLTWKTHLPLARTSQLNPELRAWNDHVVLLQWNTDGETWGFREHLDQPGRPCPILLSVPFHNRSMFPLCFTTMRPVTSIENETKVTFGRISAAMMGKSPKAVSAPPEE